MHNSKQARKGIVVFHNGKFVLVKKQKSTGQNKQKDFRQVVNSWVNGEISYEDLKKEFMSSEDRADIYSSKFALSSRFD
jgi:hypothetical protein